MTESSAIQIYPSKKKLVKNLLISIVFVAIGIWMLIAQPHVSNSLFDNPLFKNTIAIIAILFFGPVGIYFIIKRMKDSQPGLIINEDGIFDNLSNVAAGRIPWSDIVEVKTTSVFNQKFLIVIVKNPADYIKRQTNMLKRRIMQTNYNRNGSPVSFPANMIDYNLSDLKNDIENRLIAFKNKSN